MSRRLDSGLDFEMLILDIFHLRFLEKHQVMQKYNTLKNIILSNSAKRYDLSTLSTLKKIPPYTSERRVKEMFRKISKFRMPKRKKFNVSFIVHFSLDKYRF